MTITRLFIHGLDGSSQGAKGTYFRERYPKMIVEDYYGEFDERMAKLNTLLADKDNLILVGSSYGGLMATVYACRNVNKMRKLILLAPALNFLPREICDGKNLDFPVYLYHGSDDVVVPPDPVREIAKGLFPRLTYCLTKDDHSLHESFFCQDWDTLLSCDQSQEFS